MIATTIEQSKKLIELGLDEKSADMYYFLNPTPAGNIYILNPILLDIGVKKIPEYEEGDIPAWSVVALLKVLPFPTLCQEMFGGVIVWRCYTRFLEDGTQHMSLIYEDPIDAVFDCVVWMLNGEFIGKGK